MIYVAIWYSSELVLKTWNHCPQNSYKQQCCFCKELYTHRAYHHSNLFRWTSGYLTPFPIFHLEPRYFIVRFLGDGLSLLYAQDLSIKFLKIEKHHACVQQVGINLQSLRNLEITVHTFPHFHLQENASCCRFLCRAFFSVHRDPTLLSSRTDSPPTTPHPKPTSRA